MPVPNSPFLSPPEYDTDPPEFQGGGPVIDSTPDEPPAPTDVQRAIAEECDALKAMLLAKNLAYGNSALDPVRIFSRADAEEQIKVRIDNKLSRIARADPNALGEDAVGDLLGYLVLLRVQQRRSRRALVENAETATIAHVVGEATFPIAFVEKKQGSR